MIKIDEITPHGVEAFLLERGFIAAGDAAMTLFLAEKPGKPLLPRLRGRFYPRRGFRENLRHGGVAERARRL